MELDLSKPVSHPLSFESGMRFTYKRVIWKSITLAIESTGIEIWAITCDAGPTNQQLLSQLGISKTDLPFPNPADPSRHIFVLYDVPHLLKLIGSHILAEGIDVDGNSAVKSSRTFWDSGSEHRRIQDSPRTSWISYQLCWNSKAKGPTGCPAFVTFISCGQQVLVP